MNTFYKICVCAPGEARTPTPSRASDPKSEASTNSATEADCPCHLARTKYGVLLHSLFNMSKNLFVLSTYLAFARNFLNSCRSSNGNFWYALWRHIQEYIMCYQIQTKYNNHETLQSLLKYSYRQFYITRWV